MADLHVTLPSGTELALSNAGTPFARHLVILCNPREVAGFVDPDPVVTARHPVHLLVVDPLIGDGGASVTPEQQANAIAEYIVEARQTGARTGSRGDMDEVGVIGWGTGALVAASLTLDHPELIGKVALVAPDLGVGASALPTIATGPSTGTVDDRLARGLDRDPDVGLVSDDGADSIADRWAAGPAAARWVLTVDPARTDEDRGTGDLEWATDALVGSWDRVLDHVQQPFQEGEDS
jgi:pimeloyl-ACP methyl ester carboxylesterase